MSDIAIRVEGLGKKYRLGANTGPYKTLRESLTGAATAPLRAGARLARRTPTVEGDRGRRPEFWAVKDVSFDVKHGEVLGIIGRNGAGKSTLLKLLSQITEPTEGRIGINGRVASLLEVGTGFHPELTGRENVLLNGAILGMSRTEILRKFDEIVAFAEVEKFIDTPVKHYSSGMYLRLAFSVAAHLEPEVLVVDEVLAVGDAGFQKKCLGKMEGVAKEGRTVLFVSHNMQAVSQLTNRCIILNQGKCQFDGPTATALNVYNDMRTGNANKSTVYEAPLDTSCNHVARAYVHTSDDYGIHRWGHSISFEFDLQVVDPQDGLNFTFQVMNSLEQPVCHFWHLDAKALYRHRSGVFRLRCEVPKLRLYMGSYTLTTWLADRRGNTLLERLTDLCPFEVTMLGMHREEYEWSPGACAYLEDATWAQIEQEVSA